MVFLGACALLFLVLIEIENIVVSYIFRFALSFTLIGIVAVYILYFKKPAKSENKKTLLRKYTVQIILVFSFLFFPFANSEGNAFQKAAVWISMGGVCAAVLVALCRFIAKKISNYLYSGLYTRRVLNEKAIKCKNLIVFFVSFFLVAPPVLILISYLTDGSFGGEGYAAVFTWIIIILWIITPIILVILLYIFGIHRNNSPLAKRPTKAEKAEGQPEADDEPEPEPEPVIVKCCVCATEHSLEQMTVIDDRLFCNECAKKLT